MPKDAPQTDDVEPDVDDDRIMICWKAVERVVHVDYNAVEMTHIHIDGQDKPEWSECPIKWETGDTAWDPTGFVLGTVVRTTPKGWPIVRIMAGVEEVSVVAIKRA